MLYLLDGEAMFDHTADSWHVDVATDSLIAAGTVPPLVIVGIWLLVRSRHT